MNGVFIEIGAFKGKEHSNTWFLEKCLGWSGALIEGHPKTFKQCQNNRDGKCVNWAVCEKPGKVAMVGDVGDGAAGVVGALPKAIRNQILRQSAKKKRYKVPCKPMSSIIADHGIHAVDFWSLE